MSFPLLRPKLERKTSLSLDEVRQQIKETIRQTDLPVAGDVFSDHAEIRIVPSRSHFWSPQLKLVFEDRGEQTSIQGRIGPRPNVWTLFLAGYAFCVIIAFVGLMIGSSQWLIDQTPTGLWLVAASGFIALIEYAIGLIGRRLGADQTDLLREFVDRAL